MAKPHSFPKYRTNESKPPSQACLYFNQDLLKKPISCHPTFIFLRLFCNSAAALTKMLKGLQRMTSSLQTSSLDNITDVPDDWSSDTYPNWLTCSLKRTQTLNKSSRAFFLERKYHVHSVIGWILPERRTKEDLPTTWPWTAWYDMLLAQTLLDPHTYTQTTGMNNICLHSCSLYRTKDGDGGGMASVKACKIAYDFMASKLAICEGLIFKS